MNEHNWLAKWMNIISIYITAAVWDNTSVLIDEWSKMNVGGMWRGINTLTTWSIQLVTTYKMSFNLYLAGLVDAHCSCIYVHKMLENAFFKFEFPIDKDFLPSDYIKLHLILLLCTEKCRWCEMLLELSVNSKYRCVWIWWTGWNHIKHTESQIHEHTESPTMIETNA